MWNCGWFESEMEMTKGGRETRLSAIDHHWKTDSGGQIVPLENWTTDPG